MPTVEWEAEKVGDLSADDVLIDSTPRAQAAVEKSTEVCDWLRGLLKDRPVEARSMWKQAKEKGFGERRVKTGLKIVNATCEVLGYQGKWHYPLPESDIQEPSCTSV